MACRWRVLLIVLTLLLWGVLVIMWGDRDHWMAEQGITSGLGAIGGLAIGGFGVNWILNGRQP